MERGKGRPETGRMSADILSRIRNSAASTPEHQIRHLTEENRRLAYELGIAQVDLGRLQGEQEQLAEAYVALEKRHDNDVRRFSKELKELNMAFSALEKERDSLKLKALDLQPAGELKNVTNMSTKDALGYFGLGNVTVPGATSALQTQVTLERAPENFVVRRLKNEVAQLGKQLEESNAEILAYRFLCDDYAIASQHAESERSRLKGSQDFPTEADSLSMSEVIGKVSNLNEAIFQAAVLLGESLMLGRTEEMTLQETKQYTEYCTKTIGSKLTAIIINEAKKKGVHEVNPFLAQVVIQTFLVTVCHPLVELWQPNHPQYTEFLENKIYKSICSSEGPAVSSRWRSFTRKHIQPTTSDWDVKRIFKPLFYICQIANWNASDEEVWSAFEKKAALIIKAVEDLRLALGVQFTSADVHLTLTKSDQPFIRVLMEDAYGDGGSSVRAANGRPPPPEIVIGTVGLGLEQASKDRLPNGDVVYHSVQPAKVALVSTVLEALARPPQKKGQQQTFP